MAAARGQVHVGPSYSPDDARLRRRAGRGCRCAGRTGRRPACSSAGAGSRPRHIHTQRSQVSRGDQLFSSARSQRLPGLPDARPADVGADEGAAARRWRRGRSTPPCRWPRRRATTLTAIPDLEQQRPHRSSSSAVRPVDAAPLVEVLVRRPGCRVAAGCRSRGVTRTTGARVLPSGSRPSNHRPPAQRSCAQPVMPPYVGRTAAASTMRCSTRLPSTVAGHVESAARTPPAPAPVPAPGWARRRPWGRADTGATSPVGPGGTASGRAAPSGPHAPSLPGARLAASYSVIHRRRRRDVT